MDVSRTLSIYYYWNMGWYYKMMEIIGAFVLKNIRYRCKIMKILYLCTISLCHIHWSVSTSSRRAIVISDDV